jgi:hypothetical protein
VWENVSLCIQSLVCTLHTPTIHSDTHRFVSAFTGRMQKEHWGREGKIAHI